MPHSVIKPFTSLNRRFSVGDKITAADIDPGSRYSLADWQARDFVKDDDATPVFAASKVRNAPSSPSAE